MNKEIFQNRVDFLPPVGKPNHIYYVPNGNGTDLNSYVADNNGVLRFIGTRPPTSLINFADEVNLIGVVDNVNKIFTLPQVPIIGSLKIYLNGQRLKNGLDFSIVSNIITFISAIYTDDVVFADYRY